MNIQTSGELVLTGILWLFVQMRDKGRWTGRGGGSGSQQDRRKDMNMKTKKANASHDSSSCLTLDQTNNLYLLYSRPLISVQRLILSRQVAQLFLAFLRKEILCVPAYVLTTEEKLRTKEWKKESARRNIENLNKFRARSWISFR